MDRIPHYYGVPYYRIARQAFFSSWCPAEGAGGVLCVGRKVEWGLRSEEPLAASGVPVVLADGFAKFHIRYACMFCLIDTCRYCSPQIQGRTRRASPLLGEPYNAALALTLDANLNGTSNAHPFSWVGLV